MHIYQYDNLSVFYKFFYGNGFMCCKKNKTVAMGDQYKNMTIII